jgi:hypothetical protein
LAVQTPDLRSARLAVDVDAAARQRSEFAALRDPALRRRIQQQLLISRPEFRSTGETLAVAGELIAVADPDQAGVKALRREGFAVLEQRGPLLRLARAGAPTTQVQAAVASLRDAGLISAPNYVCYFASLGAIGKFGAGCAGILPTSADPGSPPLDDRRGLGVRVGVIDTGLDPQAVAAGWLGGITVGDDDRDEPGAGPDFGVGHGTFVTGLIRQLAPSSSIVAKKALAADGLGTDWTVAGALLDLAEDGVDLVNLSLTCYPDQGSAPAGIVAAIDTLLERHPDTLIVAAAGNEGSATATWPGAHKSVLCVGSSAGDRPAEYSNRGPWVDFSAPADGVVSTCRDGYAAWTGTSFAAPQVTGRLADLISQGLRPAEAVAELRRRSTRIPQAGWALTAE